KGPNIWDTLTHNHPDYISDFSNGDVAADSYHKYTEDIKLLKDIGVQFYRFSISWSRILPKGSVAAINQAGVDYYNNIINGLLAVGIQPMVTMYHWDLPQPLQDIGGWANDSIADFFKDYARLLYRFFGDRVKWWIPINEPFMIANGYSECRGKAPSLCQPGTADYLAARTMLLAHAKAYHVYHNDFRDTQAGSKVSTSFSIDWHEPRTNSTADILAAERAVQFELGMFAHPIYSTSGDYPPEVRARVDNNSRAEGYNTSRLPKFTQEEIDYIKGTWDFFALNHYTTYWAQDGLQGPDPSRQRDSGVMKSQDPSCPETSSPWFRVVPWGFRKILRWVKKEYNNPPIFITESGYSDDGRLQDTGRIKYYVDYIRELLKAKYEDGCQIIGYTAWSLIDNFQWEEGYESKFGLVYVNFSDPARTRIIKQSARLYSEIIRTRKVPDRYPQYSYDTQECHPTIPL
ncbi:hypothetical protein Cfor_03336, partial [Coptotermes formosanus]